jgi:hypothetical protein
MPFDAKEVHLLAFRGRVIMQRLNPVVRLHPRTVIPLYIFG